MKPFLKILFILSFLLLPMAVFAQQALTETFVSEDGSYRFQDPRGWFVQEDSETQFTVLSNVPVDASDTPEFNKGTVMVAFIDPSLTETFASAAGERTPLAIAQML